MWWSLKKIHHSAVEYLNDEIWPEDPLKSMVISILLNTGMVELNGKTIFQIKILNKMNFFLVTSCKPVLWTDSISKFFLLYLTVHFENVQWYDAKF